MSWEQYFEKNKGRAVRPLYAKAIELAVVSDSDSQTAVDIGCGAGIETADLLRRGWSVVAIDQEPASIAAVVELAADRSNPKLKTVCSRFENLTEIPSAEFIYSYHSLPFCHADHFDRLCDLVQNAVKPNGLFAGSFFGMNDEWVRSGHTTGIRPEKLSQFLSAFEVLHFEEIEKRGKTALAGPKDWHYIDIIAQKKLIFEKPCGRKSGLAPFGSI